MKSAARMAAEANYDPYEMGRRLRERERVSGRQFYRTKWVLVPVETRIPTDEETKESSVLREEPPTSHLSPPNPKEPMSYELKKDNSGQFRFNLKAGNGEIF